MEKPPRNSPPEEFKRQADKWVSTEKEKITADADRYIAKLEEEHKHYLDQLNAKQRTDMERSLEQSRQETSRRIEEIQQKDWPPQLKEQMIEGIQHLSEQRSRQIYKLYGVKIESQGKGNRT